MYVVCMRTEGGREAGRKGESDRESAPEAGYDFYVPVGLDLGDGRFRV